MSSDAHNTSRWDARDHADASSDSRVVLGPLERRILASIVESRAMTRAAIARELRLSRSKLSPLIVNLVDAGLLVSVGRDESRGGRRGDLLGPPGPEAAVVGGIEIDVDRIRVVIATLGMQIVATDFERVNAADDREAALEVASRLLAEATDRRWGTLVGIGVSLPAAIDATTAAATVAPGMPEWVGFPVADRLADTFDTRVFVDSDLNALALAERTALHRTPLGPAFLVVKTNEGFGCGIVIDNTVFRGSHGAAGEIGHIPVGDDETICACGHRGCLEALVSPVNLAARARQLASEERSTALRSPLDQEHVSLEAIAGAAGDGDPLATLLLREIGTRIGFVLAGSISFFNPSSIVVSTARMRGSDVLLGAIRQGIYERAFPGATRHLQIVESALGDDAVAVGAAVLARDGFLGLAGRVARGRALSTPPGDSGR
jgi:predicted NBD/HSP70 family sugar kinase